MGIKKKATDKVIKKITKKVDVDKMLGNVIDNVITGVEKNAEKKMKQEEQEEQEERKLQAKLEKSIENVKNYKVENTSEAVIDFLIEAKKNIKNKNIEPDEYDMWFLKIDEVYEKAQESITDKKKLDKISEKYKELKDIKKNKRFGWIAFSYLYITMFICAIFGLNGLFLIGLGISILVCSIITFVYFNIDFSNISKSIKEFKFKETMTNMICVVFSILAIMLIFFGIVSNLLGKAEINRGNKNYYDENVEKYNVSIEVDFKDNMLFNRCNVTLKIYDKEEYFEHGEDKTFEIKLPKGSHQLEFNGNDDTEIEKLKIDDDTKVKYKLECLSGGIEVTQVSKENK